MRSPRRRVHAGATGPRRGKAPHQVMSTVSLGTFGTDPFGVAAIANAVYVVEQGANALAVLHPRTLKVLATIPVGASPYGVAAEPRRCS
jgi:YVTN family beta-propeller protein